MKKTNLYKSHKYHWACPHCGAHNHGTGITVNRCFLCGKEVVFNLKNKKRDIFKRNIHGIVRQGYIMFEVKDNAQIKDFFKYCDFEIRTDDNLTIFLKTTGSLATEASYVLDSASYLYEAPREIDNLPETTTWLQRYHYIKKEREE